jgi:hypothetical protein
MFGHGSGPLTQHGGNRACVAARVSEHGSDGVAQSMKAKSGFHQARISEPSNETKKAALEPIYCVRPSACSNHNDRTYVRRRVKEIAEGSMSGYPDPFACFSLAGLNGFTII